MGGPGPDFDVGAPAEIKTDQYTSVVVVAKIKTRKGLDRYAVEDGAGNISVVARSDIRHPTKPPVEKMVCGSYGNPYDQSSAGEKVLVSRIVTRVSYASGIMQGVASSLRDMAHDLELDGVTDVSLTVVERLQRSADILERNGSEAFALVEEYLDGLKTAI